jgi:hypothetical protein
VAYCSVCGSEMRDEVYAGERIDGELILVMKRHCTGCDEIEHVYQKEGTVIASEGPQGRKQVPCDLCDE